MNIFEYNAIGMDPIQDSMREFKSGKDQAKVPERTVPKRKIPQFRK